MRELVPIGGTLSPTLSVQQLLNCDERRFSVYLARVGLTDRLLGLLRDGNPPAGPGAHLAARYCKANTRVGCVPAQVSLSLPQVSLTLCAALVEGVIGRQVPSTAGSPAGEGPVSPHPPPLLSLKKNLQVPTRAHYTPGAGGAFATIPARVRGFAAGPSMNTATG